MITINNILGLETTNQYDYGSMRIQSILIIVPFKNHRLKIYATYNTKEPYLKHIVKKMIYSIQF